MNYRLSTDICINVRGAQESDIDNIYCIEQVSFGKHHWSKTAFIKELKNQNSKYLVSEENIDKGILGYTGYWKVGEEGHITTVAVSPFYRRRHIADILLYSLILNAINNSIKWLTLEVRTSNIAALNLYRKFKFKEIGIRKKYYQDNNEDGFILWTENIKDESYINHINTLISPLLLYNTYADKLQ